MKEHSDTKVMIGGLLCVLGSLCIWIGFIGAIWKPKMGLIGIGGIIFLVVILCMSKRFFGKSIWNIWDCEI